MIGKTLGHYRVGEQLGRGGMGEVYVADDLNLNRKVALKFLPDAFTGDPERMARFEREAKVLASLNHPNIAAIHGLEQAEGKRFIVMELVEGETLAQRISKGAMPIEEALGICRQIAEGLEAAHEKGVIHRDLKPANVMITEGDEVKILDFGLAKALSDETQSVDSSHSPTLTEAMTRPGVILGTAAYMSPEQAKGKSVDKRADIWAFGCILYECLAGRKIFEGETVTETLAAILKSEPDWQALPESTPPNIRFVLSHCLDKDRSRRFQSAADMRLLIEEKMIPPQLKGAQPTGTRFKMRRVLGLALACLVLGSAITGLFMRLFKPSSRSGPVTKLSLSLPTSRSMQPLTTQMLALSRDGTKLAYVSSQGGTQKIFLRRMDGFESIPISGTEAGENPAFSPDGQWLGFTSGGKLMKVPIQGGTPLTLADAPWPTCGVSWGENGTIILSPGWGGTGLVQVSEENGNPVRIATPNINARWPQFLPGDQAVIFTSFASDKDSRVLVHSMKTGEQKTLVKGGTDGRYVPTGHLVYVRKGSLFAVPFDAERLETKGAHNPILEGVMQSIEGIGQFAFSSTGSLAFIPGGVGTDADLFFVDRNGRETPLGIKQRPYMFPSLSPKNKTIAFSIGEANSSVWTYDIGNQKLSLLPFQGNSSFPIWTPDGRHITFRSNQGETGRLTLFWRPADGSGRPELLTKDEHEAIPCAWSPDGKSLAFMSYDGTQWDIYILPLDKRKPYPLLQSSYDESWASFSPDGRWIAYQSSGKGGQSEVYVRPFPKIEGGVWQVSVDGGERPIWRSGELFYRNGNKLLAVEVKMDSKFSYGVPRLAYEGMPLGELANQYDVTSDSDHLLIVKPAKDEQTRAQINIVLNWFEELKHRVPVN